MTDLLTLQKSFILSHLREGDTCADFTMGNGHDTLFLSTTVGERGKVYAFDIQESALESTRARLEAEGAPKNYTLIKDSHSNLGLYIKEKIKAGMFNLGYLPGSGNKALTTMRETTIPAVMGAIDLLDAKSILLIAIYPGHEEGDAEGKALEEIFNKIDRHAISVMKVKIINSPTSPYFFVLENGKISIQEYKEKYGSIYEEEKI
ncbi:MAG: SAM-dependent methyltransferase [Ruminococcaceae bacterium]|nr:SAM-dependent methyltransferase [Oscillospiraceae bacterium]